MGFGLTSRAVSVADEYIVAKPSGKLKQLKHRHEPAFFRFFNSSPIELHSVTAVDVYRIVYSRLEV